MKKMKIPYYRIAPVLMVVAVMTILTVAGCGGNGEAGASFGQLPGDDYGNTPNTAQPIFPDNGVIEGAINYASNLSQPDGDEDWFRFQASAGVTYVLQFQGFLVPFPNASDPDFIDIMVLGPDAITPVEQSDSASLPISIVETGELRIVFTPQLNATHYIRVAHARPLVGTGHYVFNLASSQIADGSTPLFRATRVFNLFDEQGALVLSPTTVTGQIEIFDFNPDTRTMTTIFSNTPVVFDGEMDPQRGLVHIHVGTPDNLDLFDVNLTPDVPPHPSILSFDALGEGGGTTVSIDVIPDSIFHLMMGHEWYADLHFTTNLDLFNLEGTSFSPIPAIVSTHANGTLTSFQSELLMNGANVIPPVNTVNALTLLYNSAFQTFMIDFEETGGASPNAPFPDPTLVGGAMHVHLGGPGTNGLILIDLGPLPKPFPIPRYETVPWLKNVVRVLTDTEVWQLRNATYTGGWYVDLHTAGHPNGELRAEGSLEIQTNSGGLASGPN